MGPRTTTVTPTVTPAPADTGHLVTVILVVLAILLLILGLAVAAVYVYKRNVQVPGLHRIHTFVNPNYRRMGDDTNMVRCISLWKDNRKGLGLKQIYVNEVFIRL